MTQGNYRHLAADLAQSLAAELAEFAVISSGSPDMPDGIVEIKALGPDDALLSEFDNRILDDDLRIATRTRFVAKHYADAVEAGVKALNECVRRRSGRSEDGDPLMTAAFSPNSPILRINSVRSMGAESAQRGHMYLCQGVIGAWRNPRAHALVDDSPRRALMMLETINDLIQVTKSAIRTRKRKKP